LFFCYSQSELSIIAHFSRLRRASVYVFLFEFRRFGISPDVSVEYAKKKYIRKLRDDLLARTGGMKEQLKHYEVTHKPQTDEKLHEILKGLTAFVPDLDVETAAVQYQVLSASTRDNPALQDTGSKLDFAMKNIDTYSEIAKVLNLGEISPLDNAKCERDLRCCKILRPRNEIDSLHP
jgi:hypothetical protein